MLKHPHWKGQGRSAPVALLKGPRSLEDSGVHPEHSQLRHGKCGSSCKHTGWLHGMNGAECEKDFLIVSEVPS